MRPLQMALTHVSMGLSVELEEPILNRLFYTVTDPKNDVSSQYEERRILYIYSAKYEIRLFWERYE